MRHRLVATAVESCAIGTSMEVGIWNFAEEPRYNILWMAGAQSPSNCVIFACNPGKVIILTIRGPRFRPSHAFTLSRAFRLQIVLR